MFTKPNSSPKTHISKNQCLRILGVTSDSSESEIETAYKHLKSDLTPGDGATHSRVGAARALLAEVELAYAQLAS